MTGPDRDLRAGGPHPNSLPTGEGEGPPAPVADNVADKPRHVERMFSRIVRHYDVMNTLMTWGQDRSWRRLAVGMAEPAGAVVLDVGTGTADLALELIRQGACRVVALDFSQEMLVAARSKARGSGPVRRQRGSSEMMPTEPLGPRAATEGCPHEAVPTTPADAGLGRTPLFLAGDALNLPFPEGSFDAVISGFVVRNLADRRWGFEEMRRVLRPGGRVVCLEITHPRPGPVAPLLRLYFYRLVPLLGGVVARDFDAYRYLPNSLTTFPAADGLARIMEEAGLREVRYRRLSLGMVAIHVGRRAMNRAP